MVPIMDRQPLLLLSAYARRAAASVTLLAPIGAAVGLARAKAASDSSEWDGRVFVGTFAAAAVLALLVLVGGSSADGGRRVLRRLALGLVVLGALVTGAVLAWVGQGCDTRLGSEVPLVLGCGAVVAGAVMWPWIVLRAPGRWSRLLIGPAAGLYVIATTYSLFALRDVLWGFTGGCGT